MIIIRNEALTIDLSCPYNTGFLGLVCFTITSTVAPPSTDLLILLTAGAGGYPHVKK